MVVRNEKQESLPGIHYCDVDRPYSEKNVDREF